MTARCLPHRLGHGLADDVHQFPGGFNRLICPFLYDKLRDTLAPAFLAVFLEDAVQFFFLVTVHHIISTEIRFGIHAHIERRILYIGKAPFCRINLMGRNPQIKNHTIHKRSILIRKNLLQIAEVAVNDIHPAPGLFQPLRCRADGRRILVDADKASLFRKHGGNPAGMTAAPQGTVHISPVFSCHETFYRLLQHYADMMKLHAPCSPFLCPYMPKSANVAAIAVTSGSTSPLYVLQLSLLHTSMRLSTPVRITSCRNAICA